MSQIGFTMFNLGNSVLILGIFLATIQSFFAIFLATKKQMSLSRLYSLDSRIDFENDSIPGDDNNGRKRKISTFLHEFEKSSLGQSFFFFFTF